VKKQLKQLLFHHVYIVMYLLFHHVCIVMYLLFHHVCIVLTTMSCICS